MQAECTQPITPQQAGTLDGLFRQRVACSPEALAYRYFERSKDRWCDWSWREVATEVERWQRALVGEGLARGERVALLLRNCPQWVIFEQAALALGLVVVPLYLDDRPENTAYILGNAGARVLLLGDERYRRLHPTLEQVACLQRIVVLGDEMPTADARALRVEAWLAGATAAVPPPLVEPDALASIVYTSGTTGRPKGVMLSHRNILSNAAAASSLERFGPHDLFLSFLPLSHMLERTGGYYLPMLAGSAVAYARSVQQLGEDLQLLRPTVLIAVPRVFERVYGRIQAQLAQRPAVARWLFRATLRAGWRRFLWQQGRGRWHWTLLTWPLLRRLVADKVMHRLGGRLRLAVSGGAALSPAVAEFFLGLGLTLVQGYGLTEAAPVVSVNLPGNNLPASVGPPLPGVEVRIGADDELQVHGPNVMQGYWHNPQASAVVLDQEGWLHTGDQARLEAGLIHITGRLKDILVLSNGEKVSPLDMEGAIALDPLIEHVMLLGEGQPYLAALVALNAEQWRATGEELATEAAQRLLLQHIAVALRGFPGYARVRRVALTLDEWNVENGLLTPTLKLRRAQVQQRYAAQIAALFATLCEDRG